jgi:D-alanyl-D-alanine carboxypeptidase
MTHYPSTNRSSMDAFYGKHKLRSDGTPTREWCEQHLTLIDTPYPLRLAWDMDETVTRIRCHKKIAEPLQSIFTDILGEYGSLENVQKARMDLFGGCYNFRAVRGHDWLSTHAWGAAIDLDPVKNPLHKKYNEKAGMMPQAVVKIFEAYGWQWGGLWARGDAMHFQAARS